MAANSPQYLDESIQTLDEIRESPSCTYVYIINHNSVRTVPLKGNVASLAIFLLATRYSTPC